MLSVLPPSEVSETPYDTPGFALASSTASVPVKAMRPGAPVTEPGAMKLSAEPSSGASTLGGGLPADRIAARPCTCCGVKLRKPLGTPGVVGKSHSSMLPAFNWTPWLTALCQPGYPARMMGAAVWKLLLT